MDENSDFIRTLLAVYTEQTGLPAHCIAIGGGTYAHRLPNAYVFGSNGNLPPDDFKAGHGGAHGIDEAVSLDRLQRSMRIYARALLRLNEAEW